MTVGKDDKLSSQVITIFKDHIHSQLKDEKFKFLFLSFLENDFSQQIFTAHHRTIIHSTFKDFLIVIYQDYIIENISWKQYCVSMNRIMIQNWDTRTKRVARKMLCDLYYYTIESVHPNTKGIAEIKEHIEFLIFEERKASKLNDLLSDFMLAKVGTNFPLESSLNQLYLIPGDSKRVPIILNLNTSEEGIKSLLLEYYQSEVSSKQYNSLRQFIYLFKYSLMSVEKSIVSITDFSFDVFNKQYRFYQKANIVNNSTMKFTFYLIRFYLYLCKVLKEQNIQYNIFAGTRYNEHILANNYFASFYEKGYKLLVYNPFDEVPIDNRWFLFTSDSYANAGKNQGKGIDFLEVRDESLRADLKNFIWNQNDMAVHTVLISIASIIEFLNFISDYKMLNKPNGNNYIDFDVLEQWNIYLGSKKTSTRNNFIKSSKSFLKFYKDKYQIPELLINSLEKQKEDFDGGNPLTKHDIDLFSKKFQEQRTQSSNGELCYILFNLAATTKLRSGEILALERDCIIEKHEQTGVIEYYSKISGDTKVKVTLAMEKINLIEKAILLTERAYSKASNDVAKYIFIKEDEWKKDRIIKFVHQFSRAFSKIQKELEGQLDGKYRAYDLRATFIDNVYAEGIKDGIPSSVLSHMAGNAISTANKYYRKVSEAQEYAEMFAGVTITGVDVYGNILEEEEVEALNPVEQGLGGCTEEGCVVDDDQYKCLVCNHFATTLNRIPLFKKNIERLKKLKESTLNSQEREKIDAELKLYTAYYLKMLEKIGGEPKNANV